MTAIVHPLHATYIEQEIALHPTWLGKVSGSHAEKILKGKNVPYLYLLRAGECPMSYYVTFTLPDGSIKHQPIEITVSTEGWYCENGIVLGPLGEAASIEDVLPSVMHCEPGQNIPMVNFEKE